MRVKVLHSVKCKIKTTHRRSSVATLCRVSEVVQPQIFIPVQTCDVIYANTQNVTLFSKSNLYLFGTYLLG